jgi:hypothetical protein
MITLVKISTAIKLRFLLNAVDFPCKMLIQLKHKILIGDLNII